MCHNSPQTGVEYQVTQLLLVDDDTALSELLVEYLGTEGFQVDAAFDGLSALQRCSDTAYDLVVLDVMLPGLTALEVLKTLRKSSTTPVLMLTARGDDVDRIVGLEIGADDYLPKPCNPRELVARIRAILRRTQTTDAGADNSPVVVDEVELRPAERTVFVRGGTVELTSTEFNVLETLLREAGRMSPKKKCPSGPWAERGHRTTVASTCMSAAFAANSAHRSASRRSAAPVISIHVRAIREAGAAHASFVLEDILVVLDCDDLGIRRDRLEYRAVVSRQR